MERQSAPRVRTVLSVGAVVAGAIVVAAWPLAGLPQRLPGLPAAFWLLAALALVSESGPVGASGRFARPSSAFAYAIALGWGAGPALAVQAGAVLVWARRTRQPPGRAVYAGAGSVLALAAAGAAATLAGLTPGHPPRWTDVAAAAAGAAAWSAVACAAAAVPALLRTRGPWPGAPAGGRPAELLAAAATLLSAPVALAAAYAAPLLAPVLLLPVGAVYLLARRSTERERLTLLDPLTGLASRKALAAEVAERAAGDRPLALLLLDIDGFRQVNDALGHAGGDRVLVEVGRRLHRAAGPPDVVARLGGDEFAVLVPLPPGTAAGSRPADAAARGRPADPGGEAGVPDLALAVARRIGAALAGPVTVDGLPVEVTAATGIALGPRHGDDFAALLRRAEAAMYEAKRGDRVTVYGPESDRASARRLALLADLRAALRGDPAAGRIALYYQPQVDIATGAVVGAEALLRWHHPGRGPVDPGELIRAAEQSAAMSLLTAYVVDDVVAQVAAWAAAGIALRVSLNVSVRDLHGPDVADRVVERLARHGVPPERLQLEITEGALMTDARRVLATVGRLARSGVAISLDDFGTGYSSMQHLRRLPVREVKVDRSFVLGMAENPADAAIVRAVVGLARALGLRVVAEGVEDEATWRLLHAAGCDVAQGWFHARPMPPDELAGWLARYRPVAPVGV